MDGLEHLEPFTETALPIMVVISKRDRRLMSLLREARFDVLYDGAAEGMENFAMALRLAIQRKPYVSASCLPGLKPPRNITKDNLTPMQEVVLSVIGDGCTNDEAADRLKVSPLTIASHRRRIMRKLKVHHVRDLMLYAIKEGYVRVTPENTFRPGFQRAIKTRSEKLAEA